MTTNGFVWVKAVVTGIRGNKTFFVVLDGSQMNVSKEYADCTLGQSVEVELPTDYQPGTTVRDWKPIESLVDVDEINHGKVYFRGAIERYQNSEQFFHANLGEIMVKPNTIPKEQTRCQVVFRSEPKHGLRNYSEFVVSKYMGGEAVPRNVRFQHSQSAMDMSVNNNDRGHAATPSRLSRFSTSNNNLRELQEAEVQRGRIEVVNVQADRTTAQSSHRNRSTSRPRKQSTSKMGCIANGPPGILKPHQENKRNMSIDREQSRTPPATQANVAPPLASSSNCNDAEPMRERKRFWYEALIFEHDPVKHKYYAAVITGTHGEHTLAVIPDGEQETYLKLGDSVILRFDANPEMSRDIPKALECRIITDIVKYNVVRDNDVKFLCNALPCGNYVFNEEIGVVLDEQRKTDGWDFEIEIEFSIRNTPDDRRVRFVVTGVKTQRPREVVQEVEERYQMKGTLAYINNVTNDLYFVSFLNGLNYSKGPRALGTFMKYQIVDVVMGHYDLIEMHAIPQQQLPFSYTINERFGPEFTVTLTKTDRLTRGNAVYEEEGNLL